MLLHPHKYKEPLWYYLLLRIEAGRHNRKRLSDTVKKQSHTVHNIQTNGYTQTLRRTVLYHNTFGKNIMSIFKLVVTVNKSKWSHGVWWQGFEREYDRSCPRQPYISTGLDALNDFNPSAWMHGHDPIAVSLCLCHSLSLFPFSYAVHLSLSTFALPAFCLLRTVKLLPYIDRSLSLSLCWLAQ